MAQIRASLLPNNICGRLPALMASCHELQNIILTKMALLVSAWFDYLVVLLCLTKQLSSC